MSGGIAAFSMMLGPASATSPGFLTTTAQNLGAGVKTADGLTTADNKSQKLVVGYYSGTSLNSYIKPSASSTQLVLQSPNGNDILTIVPLNAGANGALSWGTQVNGIPSAPTRSVGTRAIWYSTIDAAHVDFATGVSANATLWNSVPQATNAYAFGWFGGVTQIATLYGNGVFQTTAGKIRKSRIALTTPVTIAVTDDIVFVKLTTPGPVAVNWPASPVAGQEHVVIDATGDANTNNITHTPAAGTFNGAASKVQNVSYSRFTGAYTGAEWIGA